MLQSVKNTNHVRYWQGTIYEDCMHILIRVYIRIISNIQSYCCWKKSCFTWDGAQTLSNNGIFKKPTSTGELNPEFWTINGMTPQFSTPKNSTLQKTRTAWRSGQLWCFLSDGPTPRKAWSEDNGRTSEFLGVFFFQEKRSRWTRIFWTKKTT